MCPGKNNSSLYLFSLTFRSFVSFDVLSQGTAEFLSGVVHAHVSCGISLILIPFDEMLLMSGIFLMEMTLS